MKCNREILLVTLTTLLVVTRSLAISGPDSRLRAYPSQDYLIYTDLGADQAREAQLRMTLMSAEYRRWTGFVSGDPARKLPLYLFAHPEGFYAAGGPPSASGAFIGNALLAIASPGDWHTLQHEGFHQFVAAAPGHDLPPWVEEGWAEYFGESIFTGDGYVSGVIPGWRLRRLKSEITGHQLKAFSELIGLSAKEWNDQLSIANYDQAWSMVQFLAHGMKGQYRFAFASFIEELRIGHSAEKAWIDHFGDPNTLEKRWQDAWLSLSDDSSRALYAQAAVATLSSCLGRAFALGHRFDSFADFSHAVETGSLPTASEDWLPPSLAFDALASLRRVGASCTIAPGDGDSRRIVATLPERTQIAGTFSLHAGRVKRVHIDIVTFPDHEVPPAPLFPLPRARNAE